MASQIVRYTVPVGATFIFHGTVFADSMSRPNPAAVYAEPTPRECPARKPPSCPRIENRDPTDTELEKAVMKGRKYIGPYRDVAMEWGNEGMKQASFYSEKLKDNLCYLRTRAPQEVRIGTVVAGGVTGLLLGLRGGLFRKLFMTTLGSSGGAYLAYPYESEKYTKKYSAIAYNFISGTPPNPNAPPVCKSPVSKRQAEKREQKRCPKDECKEKQKPGPPENLPGWFRCPASMNEKIYPVPPGVEVLSITEGGRNGPSKKKRFQCGQCSPGANKKKPENVKPNIDMGCPMSKTQILGLGKDCGPMAKVQAEAEGIFAKIKEFFSSFGKK